LANTPLEYMGSRTTPALPILAVIQQLSLAVIQQLCRRIRSVQLANTLLEYMGSRTTPAFPILAVHSAVVCRLIRSVQLAHTPLGRRIRTV
jgi:hypothetical protein